MATAQRRRAVSAIPPQHGAWAFLGLPVAVGAIIGALTWSVALLCVAWVCAYPVGYFALAAVGEHGRTRPDRRRYLRPALPWAAALTVSGLVLLAAQPWLAVAACGYLLATCASAYFALRHAQRALANDAILITECTAMVPITWAVAAGAPRFAEAPAVLWWLTLLVALALAASTLHVRSLLRGRGDARVARAAIIAAIVGMGAACLAALALDSPRAWLLVVPFAYFVVRAAAIQRIVASGRTIRPARVGMIDLAGFVLLMLAAVACA